MPISDNTAMIILLIVALILEDQTGLVWILFRISFLLVSLIASVRSS